MRYYFVPFIFVVTLLFLTVGCSGSGSNPSQPGINNPENELQDDTPGLTDADSLFEDAAENKKHSLWGLYRVTIDLLNETMEVIPLRASNVHLNIIKLLEPGGEYGHFQLASGLTWNVDKTELDFDMSITHPIDDMDQFSVFDMKAIIITKGTLSGFSNAGIVMSGPDEMRLMNADGYTRWWNPVEFPGDTFFSYIDGALGFKNDVWNLSSTYNGFKYFADGLGKNAELSTLDPSSRGLFRSGNTLLRHFKFWIPDFPSTLIFNYAIDVSWAVPDPMPPDNLPDDFPIEANQSEPWLITVDELLNELYYDEISGESGGQLVLNVNVYDWLSPLPAPGGTIANVSGEWPGIFNSTEAAFVSDEGTHAVYELTLEPALDALTSSDAVAFMIFVEDSDPAGYSPVMPGEPLIAGHLFSASVGTEKPNLPPQITSGIDGDAGPGLTVEAYTVVAVDPENDPLTYSWTVEDTPISDDPGNGDGTIDIDWSTLGIDNYTIACLVSDSINSPVPATNLDVFVGNTDPVVGEVEGPTDISAADTSAFYWVDAFDVDSGQTLEFMWSIVSSGDPEDFSIPGSPSGTLTFDASQLLPGLFDINVQVSDGFVDVIGTHIEVTHHNTAPTVGQVTGKSPVTKLDTDEVYQASFDDLDVNQPLLHTWSIVPTGQPPIFNQPSNPDGSINVDWSDYSSDVAYDLNVRVNDGIDDTAGNDLTVFVLNAQPSIGEITGPGSVMRVNDTASEYAVAISDVDGDSVDVLWSVVPEGSPADYSIPGSVGTPLIYDWSPAPALGDYEVNVQADDWVNPPVEGTPMVVSLVNSPPVLGELTGQTVVDCWDHPGYNIWSYSDADFDQSLTWYFSNTLETEPPDWQPGNPDWSINWVDWPIGTNKVMMMVDDGFAQVESNAVLVDRQNGSPMPGNISGPFTLIWGQGGHYTISSLDCDTDQTITHKWSVVELGDFPSYKIDTGTNNYIDLLATDYTRGTTYNIRCRITDGLETVDSAVHPVLINMPPYPGEVSGPTSVHVWESTLYLLLPPASDDDPGQTLSYLYSVVPLGNPHNYTIPSSDGSIVIDWANYGFGAREIRCQVYDGYEIATTPPLFVMVTL